MHAMVSHAKVEDMQSIINMFFQYNNYVISSIGFLVKCDKFLYFFTTVLVKCEGKSFIFHIKSFLTSE
jgi:hypothetical protein